MTYDLNDPREYLQAKECLERMEQRARPVIFEVITDDFKALDNILQTASSCHLEVEFNQPRRSKTTSQNNYLHFLCRCYAAGYGITFIEAKELVLKREACPDVFVTHKTNELGYEISTCRSVDSLTKDEASHVIRNFIEWARIKTCGLIELPSPDDHAHIRYWKNKISMAKNHI